jgi:hypothetical protein
VQEFCQASLVRSTIHCTLLVGSSPGLEVDDTPDPPQVLRTDSIALVQSFMIQILSLFFHMLVRGFFHQLTSSDPYSFGSEMVLY